MVHLRVYAFVCVYMWQLCACVRAQGLCEHVWGVGARFQAWAYVRDSCMHVQTTSQEFRRGHQSDWAVETRFPTHCILAAWLGRLASGGSCLRGESLERTASYLPAKRDIPCASLRWSASPQ